MKREDIADQYGEDMLFLDPPEQFDKCIVGVAYRCGMDPVAVYDEAKVINALVDAGMTPEEAIEWYDFNITGAYLGEKTPLFFVTLEDA